MGRMQEEQSQYEQMKQVVRDVLKEQNAGLFAIARAIDNLASVLDFRLNTDLHSKPSDESDLP